MNKKNTSWGEDTIFYRQKNWMNLRKQKLQLNPLCELCQQYNIVSSGEIIDHIIPRRLYKDYELEIDNTQTLCARCHSQKSKLEQPIKILSEFIEEFQHGKLWYICTPEVKEKLMNMLKNEGLI